LLVSPHVKSFVVFYKALFFCLWKTIHNLSTGGASYPQEKRERKRKQRKKEAKKESKEKEREKLNLNRNRNRNT